MDTIDTDPLWKNQISSQLESLILLVKHLMVQRNSPQEIPIVENLSSIEHLVESNRDLIQGMNDSLSLLFHSVSNAQMNDSQSLALGSLLLKKHGVEQISQSMINDGYTSFLIPITNWAMQKSGKKVSEILLNVQRRDTL